MSSRTPPPHPPSDRPAASPSVSARGNAAAKPSSQPARRVLTPGMAALLLTALGVLLAAGLAAALTPWFDAPTRPWAAALAAAIAVLAAVAPVVALLFRRAAEMAPGAGRPDAAHAPLVGMPHHQFMALAEREFARARRYGTGAALVLVDIDRHARLCEARGAGAGRAVLDELLRATAPTLRTADVLTVFGDAQMAVFLVHADATGALDVAERIRERSEQMEVLFPDTPQGLRLRVTVSAGVAHLRPAHLSLQAMVDDALDAVGAARSAGGNCVRAAPVDQAPSGGPVPWIERRARTRPQPPRPGKGA